MANKAYAEEWLQKAYHDLTGARLLFEADHYMDTTAYVLHQALEKTLKSIYAYSNQPQRKTHNLVELYELLPSELELEDEEVYLLSVATTYQTKQRYPTMPKSPPSKKEIEEILIFSEKFFEQVKDLLGIIVIEEEKEIGEK
jgi:HEPN domain-containing protein